MSESSGPLPLRVATVTDDADRAALERIARGELGALDDLYERYKTMAYSIAFRITNDATLAEDVVQDAFLGAWRNAARYIEGRGSVKTWLLSIVHHRAIDAVRRRRATVDLPDANVLIQVSGTFGSRQEEAQRLGRILRPKSSGEGDAHFYTLVTRDTRELDFAHHRQMFLTEQGYSYAILDEREVIPPQSAAG